ncbi:hypothetical protein OL548_11660 [Lysinibacillus sp. MHQ-1]|nr:hypothetical protein OL548_11660 [Lysinibacillus sp. MHQ-1]
MTKKLKRDDNMFATIQIALCVILILLLLLFPQTAHSGTDLGLSLFMEALFPYLLPYLVLTQWLLRLTAPMRTKTKRASLYVQAYIISALGGLSNWSNHYCLFKKTAVSYILKKQIFY